MPLGEPDWLVGKCGSTFNGNHTSRFIYIHTTPASVLLIISNMSGKIVANGHGAYADNRLQPNKAQVADDRASAT